MDEQTVSKTFKYKLKPTPEQERAMVFVVRHCRELYNAAVQERKEAWQKCGVNITVAQQSTQLPDIKEVRPEYREINAQVLQDVLARLDHAFQRFFTRVKAGGTPGHPRFHGAKRCNSFTYPQVGEHDGARLDNGFLILSKNRPHRRAVVAPDSENDQNGHDQQGSGWLVCLYLLRGCTRAVYATSRTGNRVGPRHRGVRHAFRWHAHLQPWLLSQSRARCSEGATSCLTAQGGEQPQTQSSETLGQGASDGAPPATGLSP